MSIPRQVMTAAAEADAQIQRMREGNTPPEPQPQPEAPQPHAPPQPNELETKNKAMAHRISVQDGALKKQGEEIRALREQVAELTAKLTAAPPAPQPPPKPVLDMDKFDPDLIAVTRHIADEQTASLRSELEVAKKEREAREKAEAQQRKAAEFTGFLDEFAPADWRDIDNSPAFADYLADYDLATGRQRQADYMDAFNRLDGRAMARIFRHFADHAAATKPPATPPPPTPPVVPPVAGRATEPEVPQGRIWTQAEIDGFYSDFTKGRLRGPTWTEKRIRETEADILAAYREGRVR